MRNILCPRIIAAALSLSVAVGQPPAATAQDTTLRPGWLEEAIGREVGNLKDAQSPQTPNPPRGQRSWPARHPVLMGTLVGAGAAAGLDAATCRTCGWALIGAGVGAWTGLLASTVRKGGRKYDRSVVADGRSAADVIAQLGIGERILLTTVSGQEIRATVREVGDTGVVLVGRDSQTPVEIAYSDVQSVGPQPLGVGSKAALIGGAVGATLYTVAVVALVTCAC